MDSLIKLLKGGKMLAPFAISIISIAGVYHEMDKKVDMSNSHLQAEKTKTARLEARVETLENQVSAHDITLAELKIDLVHIKDDTKQALEILRDLVSNNR